MKWPYVVEILWTVTHSNSVGWVMLLPNYYEITAWLKDTVGVDGVEYNLQSRTHSGKDVTQIMFAKETDALIFQLKFGGTGYVDNGYYEFGYY